MALPSLLRERPRARPVRAQLRLEPLESRTVPYAPSGNLWPNPQLITLSFEPDGTELGGQSSNLVSTFNADFGSAAPWQNALLRAAQTWAQQANVNFTVVNDSGADSGTGNYQQGDPNFGDIRIGGFDFGDNSILAMAFMPPPVNNYSIAGDIAFNTAQVFNVNGLDYDLYTVALHELGHALGLDHSTTTSAILYPIYQGVEYGLYADDISGIQSIYGPRVPDAYDAAAANGSFATASDITSQIDPSALTASLSNLDITTTADKDYYAFTAPAGGTGALTLTVQSAGLSLLAPNVKVYDAGQHPLASAAGSGYLGSTLTLSVNVTAGQTYYVRVAGANTSAFGTGAYGMTLNFGSGPTPALPLPNTQTAIGNPLSGGGGLADHTGGPEDSDLLTVGDARPEPGKASAGATPPSQGAAVVITLSLRPAPGAHAITVGLPAGGETTARVVLFVPGAGRSGAVGLLDNGLAEGRPAPATLFGLGAWSATGNPQTATRAWNSPTADGAGEPSPGQQAAPANVEVARGRAPIPACATTWATAADAGFGAALAVAFAPSWVGRPVRDDSRRRPALPV
jgi:hypothetical protein